MPEGLIDLRLGDWREVLADFDEVDAVITDGPYSRDTFEGHNRVSTSDNRKRQRTRLGYGYLTPADVRTFVRFWAPRCRRWFVSFTDDVLMPVWKAAYRDAGLYAFAPVIEYLPHSRCRMSGDGPSTWSTFIMVARPKTREASRWSTLPGGYSGTANGRAMIGGRTLPVMRAVVRDYTEPGDLIIDPFAGMATTLLAARSEGRNCVGAELNPETYRKACERLARPHNLELFG
jgi:site-specific DNA-methyltransferase (adenine-specific)